MATDIVITMLGVTVENGKIVEWLKVEGDPVTRGESSFVVEADKVTVYSVTPWNGTPVYEGEITVGLNPFGLAYVG